MEALGEAVVGELSWKSHL